MDEKDGAALPCDAPRQGSDEEVLHPSCFLVEERSSPDVGRYMVAKRDVRAGELLMWEAPIAMGPCSPSLLVCLGCHQEVPEGDIPRCPGCWWPLCSPACATHPRHQQECAILARDTTRMAQPKYHCVTPRYDVILNLRCLLLRECDAPAWLRVQDLESHAARRQEEGDPDHNLTVQYLVKVLEATQDPAAAHHVRDAILTNSFEFRTPGSLSVRGIYPLLARLNHACRPNVTMFSDQRGVMYVRAACDISVGTPLNITYALTTQPLWERRDLTQTAHYFSCGCVRCEDPGELGLHYSSPRCEKCDHQYLEPTTWLGVPTWECPVCPASRPDAAIKEEVYQWVSRFSSDDAFVDSSPHAVRAALQRVQETFHPHHYVWVMAAQAALVALQQDHSTKALTLKQHLWCRLLHIYDVIEPGLTRRRGVTLYQLGVTEAELARTEWAADTITAHFYARNLQQALQHLREAVGVLRLEPEGSSMAKWYGLAVKEVEGVECDLRVVSPLSKDTSSTHQDTSLTPQATSLTHQESTSILRDTSPIPQPPQDTFTTPQTSPTLQDSPTTLQASPTLQDSPTTPQASSTLQDTSTTPQASSTLQDTSTTPQASSTLQDTSTTPQASSTLQDTSTTLQTSPTLQDTSSTPQASSTLQDTSSTPQASPTLQDTSTTPQASPTLQDTSTTLQTSPTLQDTSSTPQASPTLQDTSPTPQASPTLQDTSSTLQASSTLQDTSPTPQASPTLQDTSPTPQVSSTLQDTSPTPQASSTLQDTSPTLQISSTLQDTSPTPQASSTLQDTSSTLQASPTLQDTSLVPRIIPPTTTDASPNPQVKEKSPMRRNEQIA